MTERIHLCTICKVMTEHEHLHNTAHGISDTHMSGSERFVCVGCGHTVFHNTKGAKAFPFILDEVHD